MTKEVATNENLLVAVARFLLKDRYPEVTQPQSLKDPAGLFQAKVLYASLQPVKDDVETREFKIKEEAGDDVN